MSQKWASSLKKIFRWNSSFSSSFARAQLEKFRRFKWSSDFSSWVNLILKACRPKSFGIIRHSAVWAMLNSWERRGIDWLGSFWIDALTAAIISSLRAIPLLENALQCLHYSQCKSKWEYASKFESGECVSKWCLFFLFCSGWLPELTISCRLCVNLCVSVQCFWDSFISYFFLRASFTVSVSCRSE